MLSKELNTQSNPAWESSFSTSDQDLDLTGLRFCQGSIDVQTLILDEQSISRRIFVVLQFLVDAGRKCSISSEFGKLLI